jgi:hypothetical protein
LAAAERNYGKPIELLVDAKGFPDGRLVKFEIIKEVDGKKEKIAEVNGVTKREKGIADWEPPFKLLPKSSMKDKLGQNPPEEKYSFVAKIDDQKINGGPIKFSFPLDIYIEDENGLPLDNVAFTITFSDGSKKKDTLKKGRAKFEQAPAGKFSIELEGYDFVFK